MAKLGSEKGTVEDMRGKAVTGRSVFRYGRFPLYRMRRTIPGAVSQAVADAQIENSDRVAQKTLFDLRTDSATKKSKNAGEMNARRTFRYTDEARKIQERNDAQRATENKYFKEANAVAAEALQSKMKKVSDAFRKAVAGKSLLSRRAK